MEEIMSFGREGNYNSSGRGCRRYPWGDEDSIPGGDAWAYKEEGGQFSGRLLEF